MPVNPERIILARESRGLNQAALAERLDMAPTHLSKIERGDLGLGDGLLARIAALTAYPISFFYQPGCMAPDSLAYRRREKVARRLLGPIHAQTNILRLQVQDVIRALGIPAPELPLMEISETFSPADAARKLRRRWALPALPADLTAFAEAHDIVVWKLPFGTDRVDARTIVTDDRHPIICGNSAHPGDRQRFSLAYQLGHLLLHTFGPVPAGRDTGHEANLFAAELLMPESDMRREFDAGISLPLLGELKRRWHVSMISLLYRADDLGFLTPNQKRYLVQQFNGLNIRRREPLELDVAPEEPALLRQWLARLKKQEGLDTPALAARLHLHPDEFVSRFGLITA